MQIQLVLMAGMQMYLAKYVFGQRAKQFKWFGPKTDEICPKMLYEIVFAILYNDRYQLVYLSGKKEPQ